MDITELGNFIAIVGLPGAIALLVIFRLDRSVSKLVARIERLIEIQEGVLNSVKSHVATKHDHGSI